MFETKNYEQALLKGNQALVLADTLDIESVLIIEINKSMALVYEQKSNYASMLMHYADAYYIAKKLNNINELIEIELKSAETFSLIDKHIDAFKSAVNAINLARMQENGEQMARGEFLAGKSLVSQHKETEAIQHFQNCLLLIDQNKLDKKEYIALYHDLAVLYSHKKQHEKAAAMKKMHEELSAK